MKRALPYLAILLLALTLRAIHFVDWHGTPLFSVLVGDARGYELWAQQIAAGDWFGGEVFYQAPLYPYFLATLQALFGDALWAARIAQIALGSAACVLLALAGRRFFSTRVGLVAGALLAVYAPAIYFEGLIQKATLGLFFMCLLLFLLGEFSVRRSARWMAAAGLVIGCFALTRENALLLLPIACAWLVQGFRDTPAPQRVAWLAALALGVTTVLVPVGLRNQALGDRFLVTTSQLGHNFYIGNHAGAVGRYTPLRKGRGGVRYERLDAIALAENALGRPLSPGEVSDYWLGQGLAWVRAAPGDWARLTARKWFLVWHRAEISDTDSFEAYRDASWLLDTLASWFHFGVLAPLALLGLWVTRRDWRRLWLLYSVLLALAASVAIFYVLGRYRFPLVPLLALFAAAGSTGSWDALRRADWPAVCRALLVLALAAAASNWPLPRQEEDPRSVTYYSLGVELMARGRYSEAVAQLERALQVTPAAPAVHFGLGEAYRVQGQLADSIRHYREALRLDPDNANAHNGLGAVLFTSGRPAEAAEEHRLALELDPLSAEAHSNLGNALLRTQSFTESFEHYEKAIALLPDDAVLQHNYATALLAAGKIPDALARYERAIELDPVFPHAHYWRGLALQRSGRGAEAIAAYRETLALDAHPGHPAKLDAASSLALMLASCAQDELRDDQEALRIAERAVERSNARHLGALEALAAAHAGLGQWEAATSALERAASLATASGDPTRVGELRERLTEYAERRAPRSDCGGFAPPVVDRGR